MLAADLGADGAKVPLRCRDHRNVHDLSSLGQSGGIARHRWEVKEVPLKFLLDVTLEEYGAFGAQTGQSVPSSLHFNISFIIFNNIIIIYFMSM